MLDWLKFLQIRGLKSCWITWMLYSDMGSSSLQVALEWLNALRLHGFKSSPSSAGLVECLTATCGFKTPPSHAGLVECFTDMWVQVPSNSCWIGWMTLQLCGFRMPSKSCWIGWMLYSYVGSSPLQVMLDWLNALQLHRFKSSPSHALDWLNAL